MIILTEFCHHHHHHHHHISVMELGHFLTRSRTIADLTMIILTEFCHHHHISVMELGHFLTRSGLTYPEVFSKVCHDSFCKLGNSVSLPWVIYYEAFYLHVVSSFSCIPVICPKLVLFLIPLQFAYLFCNLSECPNSVASRIHLLPSSLEITCRKSEQV